MTSSEGILGDTANYGANGFKYVYTISQKYVLSELKQRWNKAAWHWLGSASGIGSIWISPTMGFLKINVGIVFIFLNF